MTAAANIRRFWALTARWGLASAMLALIARLLQRWLTLWIVQIRKNQPYERTPELSPDIDIRFATRAELLAASAQMPHQMSTSFVEAALDRGDLCAAAFADGSIVALQWASFTIAPDADRLWIGIEPPYRYGYKGFTAPEYRGRRLACEVMRFCDAQCLERGYTHTLVYVGPANYASRANLDRLGNRTAGYAGYLRCCGHYFTFRTPGAKAHSFSLQVIDADRESKPT